MKKGIISLVIIVIVIVLIILLKGSSTTPTDVTSNQAPIVSPNEQSVSAPVSATTKVSSQTSEYKNAELGFAVKYPTAWEKADGDMSVSFIMPIDKSQVSTVAKLQADVAITSKCAFPPVTTVKERSTLKVGQLSFNMISMSNTVQGRTYFNRMYSLQQEGICYTFAFSSITLDPASKGLTGSNITQAQNNNKAIVTSGDTAFTDMVKSFALVAPAQGIDETKAPVKR